LLAKKKKKTPPLNTEGESGSCKKKNKKETPVRKERPIFRRPCGGKATLWRQKGKKDRGGGVSWEEPKVETLIKKKGGGKGPALLTGYKKKEIERAHTWTPIGGKRPKLCSRREGGRGNGS